MTILTIGLNHKLCPVAVREQLAFSKTDCVEALKAMKENVSATEIFLLSTCNRVEALFVTSEPFQAKKDFVQFLSQFHQIQSDQFESYLYEHKDEAAVKHLFKVVCGLDSLVLGENEIHGQVKESYQWSQEAKTVGPLLGRLIEKAFQIAKQIKTETKINEGATSVSSVAVELAEKIFGRLHGEKVLVLGTGEMSELTLKHLMSSGAGAVVVANRTFEKAERLASQFGAQAIRFDDFLSHLEEVDIVISSTAAPQPILSHKDISEVMRSRKQKPLFLIDIAVPRDIDSEVSQVDDVYLYNIDDLTVVAESNLKKRKKEISQCEVVIDQKVEAFFSWLHSLDVGPVVERLKEYIEDCLREEMHDSGIDKNLSQEELDQVIHRLRGKIMHAPLTQLKKAAQNGGAFRYLESLEKLFNLKKPEKESLKDEA